jgi:hypothetical protein
MSYQEKKVDTLTCSERHSWFDGADKELIVDWWALIEPAYP